MEFLTSISLEVNNFPFPSTDISNVKGPSGESAEAIPIPAVAGLPMADMAKYKIYLSPTFSISGAQTAAPDSVTNVGFVANILPPSVQ